MELGIRRHSCSGRCGLYGATFCVYRYLCTLDLNVAETSRRGIVRYGRVVQVQKAFEDREKILLARQKPDWKTRLWPGSITIAGDLNEKPCFDFSPKN